VAFASTKVGRGGSGEAIGFHDLGDGRGCLGLGAPFGRLSADQLDAVAHAAELAGGEIRLTPWRAILIAGIDAAVAETARRRLAGAGLVTEADDPRLAIIACPGSPACARASVSTREDAGLLAPVARRLASGGIGLHLSGCAKGCARKTAAPATLVGREGRYDLVLDGMAGDAPMLTGLSAVEAERALARLAATGDIASALAAP